MKVILREDVDHLGFSGDVVDVKKGYWRNYLRPRNIAEQATQARIDEMTELMERRRAAHARNEEEAKELQALLNRTVLTIEVNASEQGKLFGSVGAADIAKAIERARKMRVDSRKVLLADPIKELGTHMVKVEVFSGVTAEVKTMVVVGETVEIPEAESIIDEVIAAEEAADTNAGAASADNTPDNTADEG